MVVVWSMSVLGVMLFSDKRSQNGYVNLYPTLVLGIFGGWGVSVILNDKVRCFKFSVIDNEFYLFLMFGGFNVPVLVITCSSIL